MSENYQLVLDKEIESILKSGLVPSLLLHSCCAPCSSYVLEYLSEYFNITVLYYNPNISSVEEFNKRAGEQKRLINEMGFKNPVKLKICEYDKEDFSEIEALRKNDREGGKACEKCYRLRLEKSALYAKDNNFDYFTTTLSISPLKSSEKLNAIGKELAEVYDVKYLFSDFKKKNGFKRSTELSKQFGLYRQNYCGCFFSKKEAAIREKIRSSL